MDVDSLSVTSSLKMQTNSKYFSTANFIWISRTDMKTLFIICNK